MLRYLKCIASENISTECFSVFEPSTPLKFQFSLNLYDSPISEFVVKSVDISGTTQCKTLQD